MAQQLTLKDLRKDPKGANAAFEKGMPMVMTVAETRHVAAQMNSIFLCGPVMEILRASSQNFTKGKGHFKFELGDIKDMLDGVKPAENDGDGAVTAYDAGISAAVVLTGVAIAAGIFVAGFAVGFLAGDSGEAETTEVTIESENGDSTTVIIK